MAFLCDSVAVDVDDDDGMKMLSMIRVLRKMSVATMISTVLVVENQQ